MSGIATEVGLMLLAVGVPLALGGVHRVTLIAAALVACASIGVLWRHRRPLRVEVPWFGVLLAGVTAYTALQMVPLPLGLLRVIAPASVEVLEVSLSGAGGLPLFHPISLDPSATLWETVKIGSFTLAFIVAHNHLQCRERRNRLLLALVIGGVVAILLGLIGAVAMPGRQLMLYVPAAGGGGGLITTSFVNPNHGAAFLTLCTLLAVGMAIAARDLQHRFVLGLGGVLLGTGVVMTLSCGGIMALAVGLGALVVILLVRGPVDGPRRWMTVLVPGALGLILALSAWLAFDAIVAELETLHPGLQINLGKIELWPSGLSMVLANPWVGVGRGAFMTAFPRYLGGKLPRKATFSHLENQYLHLPAEWGLIIGGIVIVASAVALLLWIRRARSSPMLAAVAAGLLALAVHNLFDFNLEITGIALAAAVMAGALSSVDRGRSNTGQNSVDGETRTWRAGQSRRGLAAGVWISVTALVLLLVVWGGLVGGAPSADADLLEIGRQMEQGAPDEQVVASVAAAVRRHPADPWLHLIAGRKLVRGRRPEALAWLNRAMYLFPKSPSIHLETARALRRFGRRGQALLEYRLALENGAALALTLKEALPLARTLEDALSALPARPEAHAAAAVRLVALKRPELARILVRRARGRWPQSDEVATAGIHLLIADGEHARAARAARAVAASSPTPAAFHLWARTVVGAGGKDSGKAAINVLEQAQKRFPSNISFDLALARVHLKIGELSRAMQIVEKILARATGTATLARAHDLLAQIHQMENRPHRARFERDLARKLRSQ